jgi:Carboxypeptidase regulatory-like domain
MKRKTLPFQLEIPRPCDQSWSRMTGNAQQRHCDSCNKQVHNLANLSPRQIEHLINFTHKAVCARISRNADGSLIMLPDLTQPTLASLAVTATLMFAPSAMSAQTAATPDAHQSPASSSVDPAHAPLTAVAGAITDSQGAFIAGANVALLNHGQTLGTARTNEAGQFEFAVPPGEYELHVTANGFALASKSLSVETSQGATGNLSLVPGAQISVEVTANPAEAGVTMGTVSSTIVGPWYKRLGYRLRHPIAYAKYLFHSH